MTVTPGSHLGLDPFSAAVTLALVTGAFAIDAPFLSSLVLALGALAIAAWSTRRAHERSDGTGGILPAHGVGLISVGIGAASFFLLPSPVSVLRGLALAISLLPLWWIERRRGRPRPGLSGEVA